MIMTLVLGLTAVVWLIVFVMLIYIYSKTKYKPNLYVGVACFFMALAAGFGVLIGAANSVNNLPLTMLFGRCSTTSGTLGFVFLNVFAIAVTKPGEKMRGALISATSTLIIMLVLWGSHLFVKGNIGGIPMFTFTSMYKAPYGLPLLETILALMAVMAAYPTYLFFRVAKDTKDRFIKTSSLLLGTGTAIATVAYAIELTGAVPYQYMPICIPLILIGSSIIFFGYTLPRQIERTLFGRSPVSAEMVRSFVEESFTYPITPSIQAQPHVFSKTLGLSHQQLVGRKILLEFDPELNYETAIQDFANEASANTESTIIFTRMGSAIHSSLKEQKSVKFFCLTPRVSVPKKFSENEMFLPAKDTFIMFDVFDKTLKTHPEGNINLVFDNLSDLVMSIGFMKTYRFMRYTIEMIASPRTTVLFLLNQTAHDSEVTSSLRSLFGNQIFFGKEGIQTVKLSKLQVSKVET